MSFRHFTFALACGTLCALATPRAAHAQVGINVQLGHPAWGPAVPAGAQYYYIPEIGGYYDLAARNYLVQRQGRWVPVATVPGYNPASFHPVVIDYRGREPWVQYRTPYARYRRPVVVERTVVRRPVVVERVNRRGVVVRRVR